MKIKLECKRNCTGLFKKPNIKSERQKEILFGEQFIVTKKFKKFFYGYSAYERYHGYVAKKDLTITSNQNNYIVQKGKAFLYKKNNNKSKINKFLYLNSRVYIPKLGKNFSQLNQYWIRNEDIKKIKVEKNTNFIQSLKYFKNTKYVWGGNTCDGIDCSGLVQEMLKNIFLKCPRDSKDQEKFFKKKIKINQIKKGDLLFWKGHVAIALNKNESVHAYGPKKKVIRMKTKKIISDLLKKSLKLSSIRRPIN